MWRFVACGNLPRGPATLAHGAPRPSEGAWNVSDPNPCVCANGCATISQAIGSTVNYVDLPESAAQQAMQGMGMPEVMVDWFMSLNHVIKQGWAAGITDDVQRLTGHVPRRFADFVRGNAAAWR